MQFKTKVIVLLLLRASFAAAQPSKDPIWYAMMQDSNVNYYDAVRAYELYWKGKMPPPNKELRHSEAYQAYFKTLTPEEKKEYDKICWLSKVFRNWKQEVSAWVQPNGHILSTAEQTAILTRQQQELKAIERKNGKF